MGVPAASIVIPVSTGIQSYNYTLGSGDLIAITSLRNGVEG
jgi:hypothetical protein